MPTLVRPRAALVAPWILAAVLAACGGSDGEDPPAITVQPAAQTTVGGSAVTFSVAVTGSNLGYQWQRSIDGGVTWVAISGAVQATYTIAVTDVSMNGQRFRVVVTGSAGSTVSAAVELVVELPAVPTIVPPQSIARLAGQEASFIVVAGGRPTPTLQWQRSRDGGTTWSDIPGATTAGYTIASTTLADDGLLLRVVATNAEGSTTSAVAQLSVTAGTLAPNFDSSPTDASAVVGATASFSVNVRGEPAPTLQWQTSTNGTTWADIAGATGSVYTTPVLVIGDNGRRYRVLATNSVGTTASDDAVLTVTAATGGGSGGPCANAQTALAAGTTVAVSYATSGSSTVSKTVTTRVVGPATFEGRSVTRVDVETVDTANGGSSTAQQYLTIDGPGTITVYGGTLQSTQQMGNNSSNLNASFTFTPPFVDTHFGLPVGQSATYTVTSDGTYSGTINGTTVPPTRSVSTSADTWTLEAVETITVPAGTFSTCRFRRDTAGTQQPLRLWNTVAQGVEVRSSQNGLVLDAKTATFNGQPLR